MRQFVPIHTLTNEESVELYVGDVDWPAAVDKKLASEMSFSKEYRLIAAGYMAIFNFWLCAYHELGKYQAALDAHPWSYPTAPRKRLLLKHGGFGRNNIYIRNTAYVERLTVDELQAFRFAIDEEDERIEVTRELLGIVARSYSEVLAVRHLDYGEQSDYDVLYKRTLFYTEVTKSTAIVFVLSYYPEFDDQGNLVSEETEKLKYQMATAVRDLMKLKLERHIGSPASVFVER